jgi:hypothetical protein
MYVEVVVVQKQHCCPHSCQKNASSVSLGGTAFSTIIRSANISKEYGIVTVSRVEEKAIPPKDYAHSELHVTITKGSPAPSTPNDAFRL